MSKNTKRGAAMTPTEVRLQEIKALCSQPVTREKAYAALTSLPYLLTLVEQYREALTRLLPQLIGHQEFAGDLLRCAVCGKGSNDGKRHHEGCDYLLAERLLRGEEQ